MRKDFVGLVVKEVVEIGKMLMEIELNFRKTDLLEMFEEQQVGYSNSAAVVGIQKQVLLYFGSLSQTLLMMIFQICSVIYGVYEEAVQKNNIQFKDFYLYAAVYV